MTSRIVVNNIEADAGISTVTFGSDISGNFVGSISVSGVTTVAAGSTSAPSISPTGDSNTGIFFPSPDTVCIAEGGAEVVRVNSSGNVGINSTVPQTKLDVVGGINGTLVLDTAKSVSGLGTSVDFTGIPSWVKRVTVMFDGVSTSSTSAVQILLGDSGGLETSGYTGVNHVLGSGAVRVSLSTGFLLTLNTTYTGAANSLQGLLTLANLTGNTWCIAGSLGEPTANYTYLTSGSKTLSDTLTQVRITTVNGTDTFDAGTINIMYEG